MVQITIAWKTQHQLAKKGQRKADHQTVCGPLEAEKEKQRIEAEGEKQRSILEAEAGRREKALRPGGK
ncbi:MAG: hypothetical protein ACLRVT_07650 [Oscillospiraceae bacterium]